MKKKTKYTEEPIGSLRVVKDFLPSPEELARSDQKTRVTLFLSEETIFFFKKKAKKLKSSYQTMIRNLLDSYVSKMVDA